MCAKRARTEILRICYAVSLCISTSNPSVQIGSRVKLMDFKGFLDIRYTVLCIGTFFAILGLWIPSYYISKLSCHRG